MYYMVWIEIGGGKKSVGTTQSASSSPSGETGGMSEIDQRRQLRLGIIKEANPLRVCDPRHLHALMIKKVVLSVVLHAYNNVIPPQVQLIIDMLPWRGDDTLEVDVLIRFSVVFPVLMFPVVLLQRAVQKKLFGGNFWDSHKSSSPMEGQRFAITSHLDPHAIIPPRNEKAAWLITCANLLIEQHHQRIRSTHALSLFVETNLATR